LLKEIVPDGNAKGDYTRQIPDCKLHFSIWAAERNS